MNNSTRGAGRGLGRGPKAELRQLKSCSPERKKAALKRMVGKADSRPGMRNKRLRDM